MDVSELDAPVTICVDRGSRRLVLAWADGRAVELPFAVLRAQCPCSSCRRLTQRPTPADFGSIDVTSIQSMGYGVQFIFNDGHERGIYPWALLAEMGWRVGQVIQNG
ncbi:DUF971 domain-containing protein [Paraburkholderia phosphatilytica]|uniref:gamma-butyrobetaine hydroxylase-like domain-containing protein n=1 Tax=Paraburkholderia phosphatilytica TaxID=2282883 RepID=UPI000E4A778F